VDWPAFFAALREVNYTGDFVIEREAGGQRVADIRTAKAVVAGMGEGVAGVTSVTSVK
jgi:sugar phosphate isomerase/epimerase